MSTTSKKHASFVSEPMGEKDVTEVAGIGETHGKRLKEIGFEKVFKINQYFFIHNLFSRLNQSYNVRYS